MPVLFRFRFSVSVFYGLGTCGCDVGFLVADRPAAGNRELTVKDYACPFPAFSFPFFRFPARTMPVLFRCYVLPRVNRGHQPRPLAEGVLFR
jgi:hypothetical protein